MKQINKLKKELQSEFLTIRSTKLFKIIMVLIAFLLPLLIEKYQFTTEPFNIYRYIIFLLLSLFISFHLIFDIRKMYEYMYKKRYIIGICLFAFLVIFQYHGSSIVIYEDAIEPSSFVSYGGPLAGSGKEIRSDEWAGATPTLLSQGVSKNNYSLVNKSIMGGNVNNYNVNLFPGLPTKSYDALLFPKRIGFLFLPTENAFSWYWYIEYFLLFFASFEFCMLITKKKKFWSLISAVSITFAAAVQWWDFTNMLYHGMFAILLFDKLLRSKKMSTKILCSIGIGYFGAGYVLTLYPAFAVPFAYFFLGIIIWLLATLKVDHKIRDVFLTIGIAIVTMTVLLFPIFWNSMDVFNLMNSTLYPGARFSTGGSGWQNLYNYVIGIIAPYVNINNPSESSTFMGLYPLPLLIGLILLIKNRKKWKEDLLLPILMIVIVFLSIWDYIPLPAVVSKISLLFLSTVERCNIAVTFTSMILMFHILANYANKEKINYKNIIYFVFAFLFVCFAYYIDNSLYSFTSVKRTLLIFVLLVPIVYMLLSLKHNKFAGIMIALVILITGLSVHPLNRTLNSIYDKPVSKKIQQISKEDPDAIWYSAYASIYVPNYALANGATVLNSVNYYPNYDLINKLDSEHKYEEVWNRYAHIYGEIINEKTKYELIQSDYYKLQLNVNDLCNLNIKYIISYVPNLNDKSNRRVTIDRIYGNENMYIYKNQCSY